MAAIGPRPSAPITGAVTRNQRHDGERAGARSPRMPTRLERRGRGPRRPERPRRGRLPRSSSPRVRSCPTCQRRHQPDQRPRRRTREPASDRPWSTKVAADAAGARSPDLERGVGLRRMTSSRSRPSAPRLSHAPRAWTGTTKTAVSADDVAGAALRIAKPPSRMSDTVIGAEPGQARPTGPATARPAPRRAGRGRGAVGGSDVGGGPVHGPVLPARPGRRRSDPPHWAGGGLRREHLRRPVRRRVRRLVRRRHRRRPRAPTGWPRSPASGRRCRCSSSASASGRLALPLASAGSRCTASTPRRRCSSGCGPSPGGEALTADPRRHGRPRPRRTRRRFAVVFVAFNTFFNLGRGRAAALPRPRRRRCSRPTACS